jgi:hypothetical protein
MYAIALMSFDFQPIPMCTAVGDTFTEDQQQQQQQQQHERHEKHEKHEALWRMHSRILEVFKSTKLRDNECETFDQFAIYMELMRTLPEGRALVSRLWPGEGEAAAACPSGPSATIPSRMHAQTVHAMMDELLALSPNFSCVNEFNGLQGVFPVDCAVYCRDALVAFVEVDGEFHYKDLGQHLRRKDRLKEHIYRFHYPGVPLFRIRSNQIDAIGFKQVGKALASWIAKDFL